MSHRDRLPEADLVDTFDWMADRYLLQTVRVSQKRYPGWMAQITDMVRQWEPQSIAEVGCGPGYLLQQLHRALPASEIVGVDYSPRMLMHVPDSIRTECLPLGEWAQTTQRQYDVLIMSFVLRDQPDPVQTLAVLSPLLSPNGHLVVLETQTPQGWMRTPFQIYFHWWLPWWGFRFLTPDWPNGRASAPYRWLSESHRRWAEEKPLPRAFEDAGYSGVKRHRGETDVVMLWTAQPPGRH